MLFLRTAAGGFVNAASGLPIQIRIEIPTFRQTSAHCPSPSTSLAMARLFRRSVLDGKISRCKALQLSP